MATKEFKAESKRLLEMMIHSIYTHKGNFPERVYLKCKRCYRQALYFKSLTDDSVGLNKDDFAIEIKTDKDAPGYSYNY